MTESSWLHFQICVLQKIGLPSLPPARTCPLMSAPCWCSSLSISTDPGLPPCTTRTSATQPISALTARESSLSVARTSTKELQERQGQPRACCKGRGGQGRLC